MPIRGEMKGVSMAGLKVAAGRNRLAAVTVAFGMALGAAIWGAGFVSPDSLLERSYARSAPLGTIHLDEVVSDSDRLLPITKASTRVAPQPALLVNGAAVQSGVLNEPLVIGSRVQLAPGAIDPREIEVIDTTEMDAPVVGLPGLRLQLVTARLADGAGSETLQLIFTVREAEPARVVPVSKTRTAGKVL